MRIIGASANVNRKFGMQANRTSWHLCSCDSSPHFFLFNIQPIVGQVGLTVSPTRPGSTCPASDQNCGNISSLNVPFSTPPHHSTMVHCLSRLLSCRTFATATMPSTPLEDAIRSKLTASLAPRTLEIWNDSHKHAHHSAMRGVADKKETHFRLVSEIEGEGGWG